MGFRKALRRERRLILREVVTFWMCGTPVKLRDLALRCRAAFRNPTHESFDNELCSSGAGRLCLVQSLLNLQAWPFAPVGGLSFI